MDNNDIAIITAKIMATPDIHVSQTNRDGSTSSDTQGILTELLRRDPALFLERYGKLLTPDELNIFADCKPLQDDYEVTWHLKNLFMQLNTSKLSDMRSFVTKNRRYNKLQLLIKEGEYFSSENIEKRYPYLYHKYVGQYEEPHNYAENMPLSERLLDNYQRSQSDVLRIIQQQNAEGAEEEEESDSDMADDLYDVTTDNPQSGPNTDGPVPDEKTAENLDENREEISPQEREVNYAELLEIVHNKFLDGEDLGFDYTKVDNDTGLDSDPIIDQDCENIYFDDDDGYFDDE